MSQSEEVKPAAEKLAEELAEARAEAKKLEEELKGLRAESVAARTSPAKETRNPTAALERAAKTAAGTGKRSDLQEYMRKRRVLSF
jgi:uncharacterized coiled-coil DUF342 family protein